MTNLFFRMALFRATRLVGIPARLVHLVAQLLHRLYRSHRKELSVPIIRERFQMLGRLVTAYAKGQYRVIPVQTMVAVVAAILYFLNPVDLIPDALLGIGLTDDLAVLTWVYRMGKQELEKFMLWESEVTSEKLTQI